MSASGRRGARLTARAVSAALGCVALVSFATPAQAQTTLVSNYASRHASDSLAVGDLTATNNLVQAQEFQTGPRPVGYPLTSVKFRVTNLDAENVSPRVSIYSVDSSGVPGSELYLLSGTISEGEVTLTAPANAVLAANTGYYVYFEDTDTSEPRGSYRIGLVDDSDTDTGLSGWQLEDRRDQNGNGNWALNTSPLAAIELPGSIVNNAPVFSDATLSRSVEANTPAGQNVGAAIPAATDADNDTLVYSLEGADAASFEFDAASRRIGTRTGVTYGGKGKTSYSVTVKADDGWGGTDTVGVTVTATNMQELAPKAVPPRMAPPTVRPTSGSHTSLTVSWTVPDYDGQPPITHYDTSYRIRGGGSAWIHTNHDVTGTSTTLTGLRGDWDYRVRVRAGTATENVNGQWSMPTDWVFTNNPPLHVPSTTEVPADWPLKPAALGVGDKFRLLFVTADRYSLLLKDLNFVDSTVRGEAAGGHSNIQRHASSFTPIACSYNSNAIVNTGTPTSDSSVSVYWLGGEKVADDYADLYDGSWDSNEPRFPDGTTAPTSGSGGRVANGCQMSGRSHNEHYVGANRVMAGQPGSSGSEIEDQHFGLVNPTFRMYGLSGIFTVGSNTPPTASNASVTTDEDTPYTFAAADFNFADTDTGDELSSVKVVTLPTAGALALDDSPVRASDVVPVADLGDLVYTPAANANGTAYASFTFKVSDGTHESASAYTMTVNVTAVNDPATGAPTISGTAWQGETLTASTAGIADVEGRSNATYSYQWIRVDADGTSNATDIAGATSSTYTAVAADVGKKLKVKVSYTDNEGSDEQRTSDAWPSSRTIIDPDVGICTRTQVVQDALLARIEGVTDCALVSDAHLAAIDGTLALTAMDIASLAAGDFDGLTSLGRLHLFRNYLTTLPAGIFEELSSLTHLDLNQCRLATLPAGVFRGLTELEDLRLDGNLLQTLPDGIFEPLTSLEGLVMSSNPGVSSFVPEAVALPDDATVPAAGGHVTLEGSASGPWGTNVTYSWALPSSTFGATVRFVDNTSSTSASPRARIISPTAGSVLTFTLTVSGRGSSGGHRPNDTDTATVTVSGNSAPTASDGTVTTDEDSAHSFAAGEFNFADTDTDDALSSVKVVTLPSDGALTFDGDAATVNLDVPVADIGDLVFTPAANANGTRYASFTFKVSDGTIESASAYTMTVNVTAVNDPATGAPTISGTARVGETLTAATTGIEDLDGLPASFSYQWVRVVSGTDTDISGATAGTYTLAAADAGNTVKVKVSFTDDDATDEERTSAETATIGAAIPNRVPVFPAATLTRAVAENSVADVDVGAVIPEATDADGDALAYSMEGTDAASFNFNVSSRQITTRSGVTYDHEATKNSYSVTIKADDSNGGTGTVAVTIDISDVNEAPTASNGSVTTRANTAYAFGAGDFNFKDEDASAALSKVKIATRPTLGALALDGTAVTEDQEVSKSDIDGRNLTFTPATDATGSPYATFTFSVNDGTHESASAYTMTVNVTANNVPAFADATLTRAVAENSAADVNVGAVIPEATDADAGDTLAYSMEGTDAASFNFDVDSRQITTKTGVTYDHEDKSGYSVTIKADDSYGGTDTVAVTISVTDVNEPPTASNGSVTTRVNTAYQFGPGDFSFDDQDAGAALSKVKIATRPTVGTLALGGTAVTEDQEVSKSDIDGGNLIFTPATDATGSPYATFTFRVNDGANESASAYTMTVNVTANNAPAFADATLTRAVAENSVADVNVGAVIPAATDADGDDVTYSMEGTDAASFNFDVSSRQITTRSGVTYDHEDKSGYSVTIKAEDSMGGTDTVAVTINVTDANEPPTASNGSVTTRVNTAYQFGPGDFSFDDQDAGAALSKVKIVTRPTVGALALGGTAVTEDQEVSKPDIDGGTLIFTPATDASGSPYATFTFSVNDGTHESASAYTMTVNVTANTAPAFADATLTREVTENSAADVNVGAAIPAATDADGDTLAYSMEGTDAASFNFDVSSRQITTRSGVTYDHEDKSGYSVTIKADDSYGGTDTVAVTIGVTDVSEPPSASNGSVTTRVNETYTFSAGDFNFDGEDEGAALSKVKIVTLPGKGALKLDGTAVMPNQEVAKSNIDNGELTFAPVTDDEANVYTTFTFKVSDGTHESASAYTMTVKVPFNRHPIFSNTSPTRSIAENTVAGVNVGAAIPEATDADGDDLVYSMNSEADAASFNFNPATRQITTKSGVTYNYEAKSTYLVIISAKDNYLGEGSAVVTIIVTDANEPPTASNGLVTTRVNTPYTFGAGDFDFDDEDGDTLSKVKIATRPRSGTLALDGTAVTNNQEVSKSDIDAGDLTFTPRTDTQGSPYTTFTFKVNDGTHESALAYTMTVNVTANTAPSFADDTLTRAVAENSSADVNVGAVIPAATDADDDTLSYSMEGTDAVSFNFNVSSRQITTKSGVTYDREDKSSFAVTIKADDSNGGTDTVAVTIDITDVNEPPTASGGTVTTRVNTAYAFGASDFNFDDQDAGAALSKVKIVTRPTVGTLALGGTAVTEDQEVGKSAIDGGNLTFTPATDATGSPYATFTFRVNDGAHESELAYTMTVNVTANTAPDFADVKLERNVAENSAADVNVGAVIPAATDADGDDLSYSMGGTDAASFNFDVDSRQITTRSGVTYDHEATKNSYSVTIKADDSMGGTDTVAVTINVTDANEPPTASGGTVTTRVNTAYAFGAGDFNFDDQDAGAALSKVKIVTRPTVGTLALGGTAVEVNQEVGKSDIDAGNLAFTPATDASGSPYATFTFRVNDGTHESASAYTMTVNVTANTAPDFADVKLERSVAENSEADVNVGAVIPAATDADGDDLSYSMEGTDAASFNFNESTRQITTKSGVNYDHEDKSSFSVRIKVEDDNGGEGTVEVIIDITDVEELPVTPAAPMVSATAGSATSLDVSWAAPSNTGKPDIDSYDLQFRVGDTGGFTAGPQDEEGTSAKIVGLTADTEYQVQVRATNEDGDGGWSDSGTGSTSAPVVNTVPTASDSSVTTDEDTAHTFAAGKFNFSDADSGDSLALVEVVTLPSDGALALDGDAATVNLDVAVADIGKLVFTPAANASGTGYASFTFKVGDGTDKSALAYTMTVNVTAVNDAATGAPTIAGRARVGETLTASTAGIADVDGLPDSFSYQWVRVVSGTDADIAGATAGTYTLADADQGNTVKVKVGFTDDDGTDEGPLTSAETATIVAAPVNNAPEFTDATLTREVAENSGANVNVGAVIPEATDADVGATLEYSMEGADAASFNFDVSTRQISTKADVTYDFEATKNGYSVTIRVSDGTDSDTVAVTINLTNVIELPSAPTGLTVSPTLGVGGSLDASWTVPTNTDKPTITGYKLQYATVSAGPWNDGPQGVTGTSSTIKDLAEDTLYYVRVLASNSDGDGAWSGTDDATTRIATTSANCPAPTLTGRAQIWSATVSVETGRVNNGLVPYIGFNTVTPHDLFGALSDTSFQVGTNSYTVRTLATIPTIDDALFLSLNFQINPSVFWP